MASGRTSAVAFCESEGLANGLFVDSGACGIDRVSGLGERAPQRKVKHFRESIVVSLDNTDNPDLARFSACIVELFMIQIREGFHLVERAQKIVTKPLPYPGY